MRAAFIALGIGILVGAGAWANWPAPVLPDDAKADLVVVHKQARRLELYRGDVLLRAYSVSLGHHPTGAKEQEGDGRTPEGSYRLDYRNPRSSFHKALHISYPQLNDVSSATARSVNPGGMVMIHGMRNGFAWLGRLHRAIDWTDGCVAVTDREIDEIWTAVPDGTKIELKP